MANKKNSLMGFNSQDAECNVLSHCEQASKSLKNEFAPFCTIFFIRGILMVPALSAANCPTGLNSFESFRSESLKVLHIFCG